MYECSISSLTIFIKKCSEETKRKNSEQSKDRAWLSKQGERSVFVKKDKFNYYLNLGYHFGRN